MKRLEIKWYRMDQCVMKDEMNVPDDISPSDVRTMLYEEIDELIQGKTYIANIEYSNTIDEVRIKVKR